MTDAEFHQQELERQEYEATNLFIKDEMGEVNLHIWGDEDTVYVSAKNWPVSVSLYLSKDQASKVVDMINNAMRSNK